MQNSLSTFAASKPTPDFKGQSVKKGIEDIEFE